MSDATDLAVAYQYAGKSPDPSTQNGAILRLPWGGLLESTAACNEFPRGFVSSPERLERPAKYQWIEHAERGAIYAAAREGINTSGLEMVVCWSACDACARGIVIAGITKVVRHMPPSEDEASQRWAESVAVGDVILKEGGVEVVTVTERIPDAPSILRDGKTWQP